MKNWLMMSLTVVLLVQACGFHLRGSEQAGGVAIPPTYVQGGDPRGIRAELQGAGSGQFTQRSADATYLLTILGENFDRRVLSVGRTGKAREYTLHYTVSFAMSDKAGKEVIPPQTVHLRREYRFDVNQVLGNENEEAVLREAMLRDAAQQVLRRIRAQSKT